MTAAGVSNPSKGFAPLAPLAPLLRAASPEMLDEVWRRVAMLDRLTLTAKFREMFSASKRGAAFILAQELVARGIVPALWYGDLELQDFDTNQKFDAFIYDLMHLRQSHYVHAKAIRYQRYQAMLTGSEAVLHREAEYAFYQGRRPVWKLVGSLSLTETQQWECRFLRSAPIAKRHAVIRAQSEAVRTLLTNGLASVRRTAAFNDTDAKTALSRRHTLWTCQQMTRGSPSEIARLYEQMTGEDIGRQVVANQLQKIAVVLRNFEMTSRP
jgi:hypothetical protein